MWNKLRLGRERITKGAQAHKAPGATPMIIGKEYDLWVC